MMWLPGKWGNSQAVEFLKKNTESYSILEKSKKPTLYFIIIKKKGWKFIFDKNKSTVTGNRTRYLKFFGVR